MFTAYKDLNFLKKCTKNQEASNNFMVGFALSKRPHLHRPYLVTVWKQVSMIWVGIHTASLWNTRNALFTGISKVGVKQ